MKGKWIWITAGIVLLLVLGSVWADGALKHRGHPGLRAFIGQWVRNYPKSFAMEPPVIEITVEEADLQQLEAVVEHARERGVITPEGNELVKARFATDGREFKGKLRIKGKLTDHVQGSKWSFRVVAKKDGGFLGMQRFSLQHPGTRNYLCDWFYHRLSRGEGIVALRYGFCKVIFNGEDLGVYAYEEHFAPELLENNGRLNAPIVRFDPDLYWVHRLNKLQGREFEEAYAEYQAAAVDAYGTEDIVRDPEQLRYFQEVLALVDGFRRGTLKASQVFNVKEMARRHALLDLVGGHHSMDWSDVKYYFDPVSQKLGPVSYESFSAFPTKELAGAYRYTGEARAGDDLHDQLFNDPELFAAYVHELERMSRKAYLDSAFTALKGALDSASATLYREFPYKELDRSIYYRNQDAIRRMLDVPQALQVYTQGARGDTLKLACLQFNSIPVEVDAVVLKDGREIGPAKRAIVPSRARGRVAEPEGVDFVIPGLSDSLLKAGVELKCRVLGASVVKHVAVHPFVYSVSSMQDELLVGHPANAGEFPFLEVDDVARTIWIAPGSWKIERTLVLPAGYRCVASSPLRLDLVNGAEIVSYASLEWKGGEDSPLVVTSTDSSSQGVHVIDAQALSQLAHVSFTHLTRYAVDQPRSGDVSFHHSDLRAQRCSFAGSGATLLDVSLGNTTLVECAFHGGSDQLEAHFARVTVDDCTLANAHDDAVSFEGCRATLSKIRVSGAHGIALKATRVGLVTVSDLEVTACGSGIEGREGAHISVEKGSIAALDLVLEAKKDEMRYGPVRIELKNVEIKDAKEQFKSGEGSMILIDGKRVGVSESASGT